MFNIVAGKEGDAHAVLIRAAEPLDGWKVDLSGPGKLARRFKMKRSQNGIDLTGEILFLLRDADAGPEIGIAKRIGVEYAKEWKEKLYRFYDLNSRTVTKRPQC